MKKILLCFFLFSCSFIAYSQTADFNYQTTNGLLCTPSTVQFTQMASGTPRGFVWNFGNGIITNDPNPEVVFDNAGTYNVKLVVIYKRSTVTVTKQITISPAVRTVIKTDRNYLCTSGDVNFTASSTGNIGNYTWDFGDGTGIVSTPTGTIAHTFSAKQIYQVVVKATDVSGCYDTAGTTITLKDPTVKGTVSPQSGCIPAAVSFKATANIPVNSSVTQYTWNFGDGSSTSTPANGISHVYSLTGGYSPTVMITTNEGCTSTYNFPGIAFGTPPTNHVAYPVDSVICGSDFAVFVSKAKKANSYLWDFGDGTKATVTDTLARHKYKTLGHKSVTVTPAFNGCKGQSITFKIRIIGVIAGFKFTNSCTSKSAFTFTNTSQGNLSAVTWNFGDTSPVTHTVNASHTYAPEIAANTLLTVIDSITGCRDSLSQPIYTARPILINPDTSICRRSLTTFTIQNDYNNPYASYTWNVNGQILGPKKDSSIIDSAAILGNFSNYVVINNGAQYCKDTVRLNHKILVRGPELNFKAVTGLCFDSLFIVTNLSKPFVPSDSIILWQWDFGAGVQKYNVYQPEPYAYSKYGKYNVKLVAMDITGCSDSLIKPITINPLPFVQTVPIDDTLCGGMADTLIAFHNNSLQWSPGNSLSCSTCDTVLVNPSVTTTYYATATSQFGCKFKDSILVEVYPPFVATSSLKDRYICQNDTTTLDIQPPMKEITWTPATGLSSTNTYDPVARPLQTTTYTATLKDSVGCYSSSTDINVHVKSLPTVDAGPDATYPYNTTFSLNPTYGSTVTSYIWTPSTLLTCSTCAFPKGISSQSETYQIQVTSDSGCIAKDSVTIFVECKESYILMPTAFTPNNDGLNDFYYPLTRGIKTIVRFSIYNRFGNLVYEAKDFPPNNKSFGWNGQVKGMDQSNSVFVYYIQALCDAGQTVFKKGSFILLK